VTNPYLYAKVNEKLLNRWVYPLLPERNGLMSSMIINSINYGI